MALLYCDSFDHYTTPAVKGWTVSGGGGITTGGRSGSRLYVSGNWQAGFNGAVSRTIPAKGEIIIGCALMVGHAVAGVPAVFSLMEGGTVHLEMTVDGSGRLVFKRGAGGTVLGTTTSAIVANTWFHLQIRLKVDDAAGTLLVKFNDGTEIDLSAIDTRNGGTGVIDRIQIGANQITFEGAWNFYMDDLYVLDTTGSAPNNAPIGDCTVQCLFPNGNGNSSTLVGSDGDSVNNYQLVDESTPNDDTDFVESSTIGAKDTYAFGDLPQPTGIVYGVQLCPYAKKTDAGARQIVSVARLAGTEVDSAGKTLISSYAYYLDVRETRPTGGAWTLADVNAAEFGLKVTA